MYINQALPPGIDNIKNDWDTQKWKTKLQAAEHWKKAKIPLQLTYNVHRKSEVVKLYYKNTSVHASAAQYSDFENWYFKQWWEETFGMISL